MDAFIATMDDDLDRYDYGKQLKIWERFEKRWKDRSSLPTASSSSEETQTIDSRKKVSWSDLKGRDKHTHAKRPKLDFNDNERQPKRPQTLQRAQPKRPQEPPMDEKTKASLQACFDPDSEDDDPVAAIKKRQIAANRMKGWKSLEERTGNESKDSSRSNYSDKVEDTTKPSPVVLKQSNDEQKVDEDAKPNEEESAPKSSNNVDSEIVQQPEDDSMTSGSPALEIQQSPSIEGNSTSALSSSKLPEENSTTDDSEREEVGKNDNVEKEKMKHSSHASLEASQVEVKEKDQIKSSTEEIIVDVEEENNDEEVVLDNSTTKSPVHLDTNATAKLKVDDEEDDESVPLTLVSWNISSAQSSRVAPDLELRDNLAPKLISEEILRCKPDIIALQETAYPSFGSEIFGPAGYVSIGSQTALHTDEYVDLLVKRELASDAKQISLQPSHMYELPAVVASLVLPNRTCIAVASLHLPHTKEGAPWRKELCSALMKQLTALNCENMILVGDYNMRDFEDKTTEQLCGGNWIDAWKRVTKSNMETKFTWNSRVNRYHGADSPQWICRLDRCYVKSEKVTFKGFNLIGDKPINRKEGDYLSDHFGIQVLLEFAASNAVVKDVATTDCVTNVLLATNTSSKFAGGEKPSSKKESNASAIRAARLQRFDNAANSGKKQSVKTSSKLQPAKRKPRQNDDVIVIDSDDDDDDNTASNILASDRALAERLQREEDMRGQVAYSAPSTSQEVDYSNVRHGVFDSMRCKRAYSKSDNGSNIGEGMSPKVSFTQGGVFKDSHEQAFSSGGWVWVKNPQYANNPKARNDSKEDVARMSNEWTRLKESKARITHQHLIDLATRHNVLHGKWLLYIKNEEIKTEWPKIRNAVIGGKLGSTAKIADEPDARGWHVVCVYCPNFLDKDELLRVRRAISNDVGMYKTSVLRFKLDATTYLDVYSGNEWKLKTCSYECGGKKDEYCSTLMSSWEKCTCTRTNCKRCYKPKGFSVESLYSITGLKYAEATAVQGEKVTLLREPENVGVELNDN